jgi:hypothetical protein
MTASASEATQPPVWVARPSHSVSARRGHSICTNVSHGFHAVRRKRLRKMGVVASLCTQVSTNSGEVMSTHLYDEHLGSTSWDRLKKRHVEDAQLRQALAVVRQRTGEALTSACISEKISNTIQVLHQRIVGVVRVEATVVGVTDQRLLQDRHEVRVLGQGTLQGRWAVFAPLRETHRVNADQFQMRCEA